MMMIQKILYFPGNLSPAQILTHLNRRLPTDEREVFRLWPEIRPQFSLERTPTRDKNDLRAFLVRAEIPEAVFQTALPGYSPGDARFIFTGSILEFGWETVPREADIAFLYAEYRDGDLHSVLMFDGAIRRYTMRNQLTPNINRRFTRFVILYPDIISFIEEANSNFPRQCYVISRVIERVAGKSDALQTIAKLNGVWLNVMDDYITLMEKIAGKEIVLSHGRFQLEPITWPIVR